VILLPTPATLLARRFPQGLPLVRDQIRARVNLFSSSLDPEAAPGDPRLDLDAVAAELPTTVAELHERMRAWTGELVITPFTRALIDATISLDELPRPQRSAIRPFVLATLATIPGEWHDLLAPNESRLEEHLAAQAIQTPFALLQVFFGPGGTVRPRDGGTRRAHRPAEPRHGRAPCAVASL
jgi:hypothetical protein